MLCQNYILALTHLSVKSARPHQGIVQDVGSVGGCNDNDASVALKAIHLCKKLVQGLLALVIASTNTGSTRSAHSINLIHKDNAWCILLGLQKGTLHQHDQNRNSVDTTIAIPV